jgi:hypothetical protein
MLSLWEISLELRAAESACSAAARTAAGRSTATSTLFQNDPHWRDQMLFHEYFNGDTGEGLGASHQTGWTALVAKMIQQLGDYGAHARHPDWSRPTSTSKHAS